MLLTYMHTCTHMHTRGAAATSCGQQAARAQRTVLDPRSLATQRCACTAHAYAHMHAQHMHMRTCMCQSLCTINLVYETMVVWALQTCLRALCVYKACMHAHMNLAPNYCIVTWHLDGSVWGIPHRRARYISCTASLAKHLT
jgi:hypothetical protein